MAAETAIIVVTLVTVLEAFALLFLSKLKRWPVPLCWHEEDEMQSGTEEDVEGGR